MLIDLCGKFALALVTGDGAFSKIPRAARLLMLGVASVVYVGFIALMLIVCLLPEVSLLERLILVSASLLMAAALVKVVIRVRLRLTQE